MNKYRQTIIKLKKFIGIRPVKIFYEHQRISVRTGWMKKEVEKIVYSVETMAEDDWQNASSVYDFTVKSIKGEEIPLELYRGKPLIIVNVASQCGLTATNYNGLAELYEKYKDSKNLRILGFPCNQFANEEPGTSEDVVCFALSRNANFDLFEKVNVNGYDAHPLWKFLKYKQGGVLGDSIKWNFTKFIVDKNGQPVERFAPTTPPHKLEKALAKYW